MHYHIIKGRKKSKFWLKAAKSVTLANNYRFSKRELAFIKKALKENFELLAKAWEKHCQNLKGIMNKKKTDPFSFYNMPTFENIEFTKEKTIRFYLSDKRIIEIPLSLRLKKATKKQKENMDYQNGHFVFWDDIDEIIGVKNLLDGTFKLLT